MIRRIGSAIMLIAAALFAGGLLALGLHHG